MRVLVVNGFSDNYNGKKRFDEFVSIIREVFLRQKQSLLDVPELILRDKSNLDDYLYEPNSRFTNKEAEKTLFLWKGKAICFLGKKGVKNTNKSLFTAGFGMQMLIYFCGTNMAEIEVINGNQKGGPLTSIKDVNAKMLPTLNKNQVFLDNLTGDYYSYDKIKNEWVPVGNVGMHYQRAMASLGGLVGGDLIKKVTTYQQKDTSMKPVLFYSKLTDVKCSIKKQYISHGMTVGLPQEFVVDNHNTWDPHPVNITNLQVVETNYDTLAESERGPQIAIHQNTVAVQFHIDRKYKETIQVMNNFVVIKLSEIQSKGKIDLTLDQAYLKIRQNQFNLVLNKRSIPVANEIDSGLDALDEDQTKALMKSNSTSVFSKPTQKMRPLTAQKQTFTKEFQHSGLGYSKRRGAVIVDNNAVSKNTISATTLKEQTKQMMNRSSQKFLNNGYDAQGSFNNQEQNKNFVQQNMLSQFNQNHFKSQRALPTMNQLGLSSMTSQQEFPSQLQQSSRSRPLTGILNRQQTERRTLNSSQSRVTFAEQPVQTRNIPKDRINSAQYSQRSGFTKSFQSGNSSQQMNQSQKSQPQRSTLRHLRNYQIEQEFKDKLSQDAENLDWKTQKEIRQMLHPTLCEEFLPEDREMTTKTGLLSASRSSKSLFKNSINQTPSQKVFSRFQEFKRMPQYDMEKVNFVFLIYLQPIIRNASPYVGNEQEQLRIKDIEAKHKFLNKVDFVTSFGKATTNNANNFIPNYVTATPSQPPLMHKFREEDRGMWVSGPFKQ